MDVIERKIVEGLRLLAKRYGGGGAVGAEVKDVDSSNYTCTVVTDDEEEIPGVLYKSTTVNVDVVYQPAVGSKVFIEKLAEENEYFIVVFGAIDKVVIKIGNTQFEMTENGIVMNGGELGGLLKLAPSVERWNKIEQDLNALKTVFKTWIPVASDGGAALKTAATTWANALITETTADAVKNDKVKQ